MADRDLSGLRAYAEELTGQFQKIRSGLADLQKEMAAVVATATSPDGHVTATVGPRGQLVKLQLDARIYRKPDSVKLAQTITETIHKATAEAARLVDVIANKHAPGADVASYLRGDLAERFGRFDFIQDELAKEAD